MVRQVAGKVIGLEMGWLLLLSPLFLFPTAVPPSAAPLLAAVPLLWLLRRAAHGTIVPRTPLDGAVLLLLAMVLLSQWATPDAALSLPKVTGTVLGVAFLYGMVAWGRSRAALWANLALLVGASCAVAAVGLVGSQWSNKIPLLARLSAALPRQLQGLPGSPPDGFNPNSVAGALLFAMPLLVALVWHHARAALPLRVGRGPQVAGKVALMLALALVGGTLILTQSRAGFLGAGVGLAALAALARPRLAMGVGSVALALALAGAVAPGAPLQGASAAALQDTAGLLAARGEIWSRALYAIQDFPLSGMGMGTFRQVAPVLYPMATFGPESDIGHAHNHLLAAGLDLGLPGLVAYLALWLGAAGMGWQVARHATDGGLRAAAVGLLAGLAAHFTWGLADANVIGSKAGLLFWLALGAMASLHRLFMETTPPLATMAHD